MTVEEAMEFLVGSGAARDNCGSREELDSVDLETEQAKQIIRQRISDLEAENQRLKGDLRAHGRVKTSR